MLTDDKKQGEEEAGVILRNDCRRSVADETMDESEYMWFAGLEGSNDESQANGSQRE